MEGVWSWANHIQAIHSQSSILRFTKVFGQRGKKKHMMDEVLVDEILPHQHEGKMHGGL